MGRDGISASLRGWDTHKQLPWGSHLLFITYKKKNKVAFGTTHFVKAAEAQVGGAVPLAAEVLLLLPISH